MYRLRTALTLVIFLVALALPGLLEAGRGRSVRPRPTRWTRPDGSFNRSAWARDRARNADGSFAPGYRAGRGPTGGGGTNLPAVRPGTDIATTSAGGRYAATRNAGNGGGGSTALARRDAGGPGTAIARRDAGGTPARVGDGPNARGGADGSFTEAAFHEQARRNGMQRIDGPDGTVGYRNPADGTTVHYIPAEGRMAVGKPDGSYEMVTVLNRDAIDTAFRRGQVPPRAQVDVQPIGARTRAGADAPSSTAVAVRNANGSPTVRPSTDAGGAAGGAAAATATRSGRFGRVGRGLLLGTAAFAGGYALRNTVGNDPNNSPGSIDNTPGFGQGSGPGGTAGSGGSTNSGVTNTGGNTALGSGALYNNGGGGNGNSGAPGVGNTNGATGPNGIVTGDPRDRTTSDQDQDGFAVGSLNRPPSRVRLSTGDFNFER